MNNFATSLLCFVFCSSEKLANFTKKSVVLSHFLWYTILSPPGTGLLPTLQNPKSSCWLLTSLLSLPSNFYFLSGPLLGKSERLLVCQETNQLPVFMREMQTSPELPGISCQSPGLQVPPFSCPSLLLLGFLLDSMAEPGANVSSLAGCHSTGVVPAHLQTRLEVR